MSTMPTAPQVTLAMPGDVPELAQMRRAEGWAANEDLMRLLVGWTRAHVLLMRDSSAHPAPGTGAPPILGTTLATAYGPIGFIGNVIVASGTRGKGYGKVLMTAALDWLKAEATRTVLLDATRTGRPLYERFDFVATLHSWEVWQPLATMPLDNALGASGLMVTTLTLPDIEDVGALDAAAFGGDRRELLAALTRMTGTSGYLARDDGGAVASYLMVRPLQGPTSGLHVGPLVARSPEAARILLIEAVGRERIATPPTSGDQPHLSLGVPGTSGPAIELYRALGLRIMRDDMRMRLDFPVAGAAPAVSKMQHRAAAGRPEWLYAMLSTMLG